MMLRTAPKRSGKPLLVSNAPPIGQVWAPIRSVKLPRAVRRIRLAPYIYVIISSRTRIF